MDGQAHVLHGCDVHLPRGLLYEHEELDAEELDEEEQSSSISLEGVSMEGNEHFCCRSQLLHTDM